MKKIFYFLLLCLFFSNSAFAYFGNQPFGCNPFGIARFNSGAFGESANIDEEDYFLLLETGNYLLLETGDKILLQ